MHGYWPHARKKKYRNGARAYKLIAKELESNETHENFKILAAAHAEMGDFKAAVLYQERAIEIIRQITPAHKSEEINLQKDLKIYKEAAEILPEQHSLASPAHG